MCLEKEVIIYSEKGKWLKLIDSRSKKYRRKRNMEKLYKDRENNFIEAFCSLWPASRDLKKAEPSKMCNQICSTDKNQYTSARALKTSLGE